MDGWIKIYRKIADDPLYLSESFTRIQAWIDLLLVANYKDSYISKRGIRVIVKRGEVGYSVENLACRWRWSRGRVSRYLDALEVDGQIVRQKTNVTTLISICNYDVYQLGDTADVAADDSQNSTADGHQMVQQTEHYIRNKERKKIRSKDKEIGEIENFASEYINPSNHKILRNPKEEKSCGKKEEIADLSEGAVNFRNFQQWILVNAAQVSKFKEPFTQSEFERLKREFDVPTIQNIISAMHNWKPLLTKNVNANLTFRRWASRDKQIEKNEGYGKNSKHSAPNDADLMQAVVEGLSRSRTRQEWEQ